MQILYVCIVRGKNNRALHLFVNIDTRMLRRVDYHQNRANGVAVFEGSPFGTRVPPYGNLLCVTFGCLYSRTDAKQIRASIISLKLIYSHPSRECVIVCHYSYVFHLIQKEWGIIR